MTDAYVETTVLTDLLLKPNSKKQKRAKASLDKYDKTLLPVYSIKEMKAGPLDTFAYVHDKLVQTRSLADTMLWISELSRVTYLKSTANEAIAAAGQIAKTSPAKYTVLGNADKDQADSYRLSLASHILRSWKRRRRITTEVVDDLPCYLEAAPRLRKDGFFDLNPTECNETDECCLASALKAKPEVLEALRDAIPRSSARKEDTKRKHALKQLIKHPNEIFTREMCSDLGDAIFAFFCPMNAVILTTNLRDHESLAAAVGKSAESPWPKGSKPR
jgi:hypothetical protein